MVVLRGASTKSHATARRGRPGSPPATLPRGLRSTAGHGAASRPFYTHASPLSRSGISILIARASEGLWLYSIVFPIGNTPSFCPCVAARDGHQAAAHNLLPNNALWRNFHVSYSRARPPSDPTEREYIPDQEDRSLTSFLADVDFTVFPNGKTVEKSKNCPQNLLIRVACRQVGPVMNAGVLSSQKIGEMVRQRRLANRLTQRQLGELAGVGLRLVSELERGKPTLRMDAANRVLTVFGLMLGAVEAPRSEEGQS